MRFGGAAGSKWASSGAAWPEASSGRLLAALVPVIALTLTGVAWSETPEPTPAPAEKPVDREADLWQADSEAADGPETYQELEDAENALDIEEPEGEDPLEDVETMKVTGRRREELLQEVPVSIRAFDAAELNSRNITRIDEVGFGTANLTFDATNGSNRDARIYIRGIGQDDPRTIVDPAVGMYVDNVYIPRATNALLDVVDFERVEVLRGPQGTLYGKNTVGGVINIVTVKPGTEVGGYVDGNFGTYNLFEGKAALDLPVTRGWFDEKLYTRWVLAAGTEDGYTINLQDGENAGNNNYLGVRHASRLIPFDGFIADLVVDWQGQGERSLIGKCIPGNPYNIARYVTDNFIRGPAGETYVEACNAGVALGPFVGYAKPLQKTSTDTVGTSLQMDYQLPESSTWIADFIDIKSITGYRQRWDDISGGDLDATPLDYLNASGASVEHWAVSQDLNVNMGFWDERIDLITGGYYFQEQGDESASASILRDMAIGNNSGFPNADPNNPVAVIPGAETYPTTLTVLQQVLAPFPAGTFYALGLLNQPGNPNDATGDVFWRNAVRWGIGELNAVRDQQWTNSAWAIYSHMDIEVVPDVTLQGGIRYTDETKTRSGNDQRIYFSQINATVPPFTIVPPMNPPGTGTQRVVLDQSVDFTQWTPEAGIKWQINDEHMAYFRFANGWKSGGLRVTALTAEEAARRQDAFLAPYDPEEVYSYEVGVKTQWLDNQVFVNGTLFWNDYQDLQVTSLEPDERGIVSALINNAESAVTRGFEVEGSYLPDWAEKIPVPGSMIALTAGLGLTDAFYTQFTGTAQPLVYPQVVTDGCPDLVRGFSSQCNGDIDQFVLRTMITATGLAAAPAPQYVDLSDNQFKNTPRFNMNASLTYGFEPTRQTELALRMDWSYRSTIYYTTINRSDLASGPLNLLNLSAAFEIVPTDTQIVVWVKNVTDEVTISGALNLGAALGADAVFYSKPRTFGARIIQRF